MSSESRMPSYNEWTLIQKFSDSNAGDIVSFDTGIMGTVYDIYKVIGWMKNEVVALMSTWARINGISSATYRQIAYSSGGIVTNAGLTAWSLAGHSAATTHQSIIEVFFKGSNNTYPLVIGGTSYSIYTQGASNLRGDCSDSAVAINRIHIYTDRNSTGKMRVYGMNL